MCVVCIVVFVYVCCYVEVCVVTAVAVKMIVLSCFCDCMFGCVMLLWSLSLYIVVVCLSSVCHVFVIVYLDCMVY